MELTKMFCPTGDVLFSTHNNNSIAFIPNFNKAFIN